MDQALIDQIIKRAVDLLLEKMIAAAPKQRVLMLFSGAGTGYVVGLQAIQWLAKAGHPLTVIMTASARHVIGEENVRKAGAAHLIGDNEWVNTPKFVREFRHPAATDPLHEHRGAPCSGFNGLADYNAHPGIAAGR